MFSARYIVAARLWRMMWSVARHWFLLGTLLLAMSSRLPAIAQTSTPISAPISAPNTVVLPPVQLHMPMVIGEGVGVGSCPVASANQYDTVDILGEPRDPDRPPLLDPDLNLSVRGYKSTVGLLQLIAINGPTDDDAPQLAHLFRPVRVPAFRGVHQIFGWDWDCQVGGCLGQPIASPEVTLVEMGVTPAERLYPPRRNASIDEDFIAMVLYAEQYQIAFTYTRQDSPANGYLVHVNNFCVDPNLLALYQEETLKGREELPALLRGDSIGTALTDSVFIAVRDTGSFMDPRSGKDWWQETVRAMLAAQSAQPAP